MTSRSPPPSACWARRRSRCSAAPTWRSSCAPAAAPATSSLSTRRSARRSCARSSKTARSSTCTSRRTWRPSVASTKPTSCACSAFNVTEGEEKGNCRILASVGDEPVADVVDEGAGEPDRPGLRVLGRLGEARKGRAGQRRRRRRPRTEPLLVAPSRTQLRHAVDVFDRAAPLLRCRPARCSPARAAHARGRRRCEHRGPAARRSLSGWRRPRRSGSGPGLAANWTAPWPGAGRSKLGAVPSIRAFRAGLQRSALESRA